MRIVKPSVNEDPKVIQKRMALDECCTCPSCSSDSVICTEEYDYAEPQVLWIKQYTRTEFKCMECGCIFESDPYDFEAKPSIAKDDQLFRSLEVLAVFSICVLIGLLCLLRSSLILDIIGSLFIIIACSGSVLLVIYLILINRVYKKHSFYKVFEPKEVHRSTRLEITDGKSE
jgi:hypothetical protein